MNCTCQIVEKEYLIQECQRKLKDPNLDAHQLRRLKRQLELLEDAMMIHRIMCCTKKVAYIT